MNRMTDSKPPRNGPRPRFTREDEGPTSPLIAGSGLWAPFGTVNGREFGTVTGMPAFDGREFELIDDGHPVVDLSPGSFYLAYPDREPWRITEDEYGNDRTDYIDKFRRIQPWPLGTFDKLTKPRAAGKAKDAQPLDSLTGLPFLRGRAPTRQNILALLTREGVTVERGARGELLPATPGGRWPKAAVVEVLHRPGMPAYLTADPPVRCAWPHDAEAPQAQTLDAMGNGLCSSAAHKVKPATGLVGKLRAAVGLT